MYYIIITNSVYSNKTISDGSKLLYGLILSLSQKDGYCYADNEYLADTLDKSKRMINYYLTELKEANFLFIDYIKKTTRRITTQDTRVKLKPEIKAIAKSKNGYKQDVARPEWLDAEYLSNLTRMDK